ncbi:MAG: glycosyltransferase family 2 protein [Silvibacterium sp.]|jgi:cellulose synthase/poly-beta-1,6-N-acetylglucosamine synthase-like glycosyltransferase
MTHLLYLFLGLVLVAVTLPLVLELALVTTAALLPVRGRRDEDLPVSGFPLAIVIPAHNEEFLIARCVKSVRESASQSTSKTNIGIFVIAHNCTDTTAQQARKAGAEVLIYDDLASIGKGFALRHGFEYALASQAKAVLVIDADSIVSKNLVPAVQHLLAKGADAVQCRYEMESSTEKSNSRLAALALRGFNVIRPRGRERLGLSTGIFGNGFALSRSLLRDVPYGAFSVVEDLEYHITMVLAGKQVRFLETAQVSATLPVSKQGEQVQHSRWEGGRFHVARTWTWPLLKQLLRGRIRLSEPLFDIAGLPMAYGVFALLLALCVPVAGIRIYAVASLLVIAAHVLVAAASGPDVLKTLGMLAMAPLYIVWKLRLLPAVLRGSREKATWIRTNRDSNFRSIS